MTEKLDDFDPLDLSKKGSMICVVGPSGSGKTHYMKHLVRKWSSKNLFNYYYCMTGSSQSGDIDFLDEKYISPFSLPKLKKFIEIAKKLAENKIRGLLILDDIGGTRNSIFENEDIVEFWSNFRHMYVSVIICSQYLSQIPPIIRTNVYVYVVFNQNWNEDAIKYLRKSVCIGKKQEFDNLLEIIHDTDNYPHVGLVVDKQKMKYHFTRAPKTIPDFKIGKELKKSFV